MDGAAHRSHEIAACRRVHGGSVSSEDDEPAAVVVGGDKENES